MSEKFLVKSTLFKGRRGLKINPALATGNTSPRGVYLSQYNNGASQTAKISYAAVVLEYILQGRVAACTINGSKEVIYAEIYNSTGGIENYCTFDCVNRIHWNGVVPANSSRLITPIVLFAISPSSGMTETRGAFDACVSEFQTTGTVSEGALYKFCDSLYYEYGNNGLSNEIDCDELLELNLIKQAIRTNQANPFDAFVENALATPAISIETMPVADTSKQTTEKDSDIFEACKKGFYYLDYCWEEHQTAYIPGVDKLESFVPNESFFTLVDLIHFELQQVLERLDNGAFGVKAIGDNYVNAILCGKPGTGKTTLANALGAAFGLPVRTISVSKNTEEDMFQGMTKVADGGFQFQETPFLDVYKNGGIILLEEFNLTDPAVMMGALGQAIIDPFILYEDGYKEVHRHPMCVVIATMNTGTQGSREPSEAFTSRNPDVFMLDDPTEDQFIAILCKKGYEKRDCKKVYNVYKKILTYLTSSSVNAEDVALSITLRHCLAALRQIKIGRSAKQAIRNTMIGVIGLKDLKLAQEVYDTVVEPLNI